MKIEKYFNSKSDLTNCTLNLCEKLDLLTGFKPTTVSLEVNANYSDNHPI